MNSKKSLVQYKIGKEISRILYLLKNLFSILISLKSFLIMKWLN
jgi:hypothetical protein